MNNLNKKKLNKKKSNKVYVYDMNKAKFFMVDKGIKPIDQGIHRKTGKMYFVFDYYSTIDAFREWALRLNK